MMPSCLLHLEFWEILGIAGAVIPAGSFTLVAFTNITRQQPVYFVCTLVAAALMLFGLSFSFNLAAAIIRVFFLVVSIIGLVRHLAGRSGARRRAGHASGAQLPKQGRGSKAAAGAPQYGARAFEA